MIIDGRPISGELLKAGGDVIVSWLLRLYRMVTERKEKPEDWEQLEVIPTHKKGDVTLRENYRPISLLSNSYKVFAKIVQNRMKGREEEILGEEQAGFRSGRGTIDQIFTLTQIAQKYWEKNKPIYCAFIDFKQAFDSVWRENMIRVLK